MREKLRVRILTDAKCAKIIKNATTIEWLCGYQLGRPRIKKLLFFSFFVISRNSTPINRFIEAAVYKSICRGGLETAPTNI